MQFRCSDALLGSWRCVRLAASWGGQRCWRPRAPAPVPLVVPTVMAFPAPRFPTKTASARHSAWHPGDMDPGLANLEAPRWNIRGGHAWKCPGILSASLYRNRSILSFSGHCLPRAWPWASGFPCANACYSRVRRTAAALILLDMHDGYILPVELGWHSVPRIGLGLYTMNAPRANGRLEPAVDTVE